MKSWKKHLKDAKKKEKQKMSMKQQNVQGGQVGDKKKKDSLFQGQQQMKLMQQRQGKASEQLAQIEDSNPEGKRRVLPEMSALIEKKMEDWQSITIPITSLPEFDWVKAETHPTCADCDLQVWDASFAHVRHHHCRACGEVFCGDCSPQIAFEATSDSGAAEIRCCRFCVADYLVKQEAELQARETRLAGVSAELAKAKGPDSRASEPTVSS
jgi:hypothetical protein